MTKTLSEEHKRNIGLAHKGRKLTQEVKDKIRTSLSGHAVSNETREKISKKGKGRIAWNTGKSWSEEMKKRISDTNKKKGIEPKIKFIGFGENHPMWKGGITPINKKERKLAAYKFWRKSVFERDNYTCRCCCKSGGKLRAHHINNFADCPELRTVIENGITLCENCHKEFHKKCGTKNNVWEQLLQFIENYGG